MPEHQQNKDKTKNMIQTRILKQSVASGQGV